MGRRKWRWKTWPSSERFPVRRCYPSDAVSAERLTEEIGAADGDRLPANVPAEDRGALQQGGEIPGAGSEVVAPERHDRVTVVGAGVTVYEALKAADQLKSRGVGVAGSISTRSSRWTSGDWRNTCAPRAAELVTVEDHYPEGGIGEAGATALTEAGVALTAVRRLASTACRIPDSRRSWWKPSASRPKHWSSSGRDGRSKRQKRDGRAG